MRHWLTITAGLFLFGGTLSFGAVINPTDSLEIQFSVSNAVPADDTLWLGIVGGTVDVLSPYTAAVITIDNGAQQLGSLEATQPAECPSVGLCSWGFLASFQSASSQSRTNPYAVIPFASIQDGTIQGTIDITVLSGAVDLPLAADFSLGVSQPNGTSLVSTSEQVNVLSTRLVTNTPEPSTLAMACLPVLLFFIRRLTNAKASPRNAIAN